MKIYFQFILVMLFAAIGSAQTVDFQREANLVPENYSITGIGYLEELSNGDLQFRLSSNFTTPQGPDVRIFLNSSVSSSGGVEIVNLSAIGHFNGALTVPVPSTVDIEDYDFVVFYCLAFQQLWASGQFGPTINIGGPVCNLSGIQNPNGPNNIDICPSDNISDLVFFENTLNLSAGSEYVYLITDQNEILQQIVNADQYDFEGSNSQTQRVYGMHYNGTINPMIGSHRTLTTATGCFAHSNVNDFISITKNGCFNCLASAVTLQNGASIIDICPSDNLDDWLAFNNSLGLNAGTNYAYLITNTANILQEVVFSNVHNFEGSSLEDQRVFGIHYDGTLNPQIGQNRMSTTASGCFAHSSASNFISITKDACPPIFVCLNNTVSSNGSTTVSACASDGIPDPVNLDNDINVNAGDHYAYLLTDDSNILLEVIASESYDFENASLTELRVYGIHYDGILNPQIGSNRLSTSATGCFTHSDSNDFLTVLTDDCAPIFVCLSNTVNANGSDMVSVCASDGIADLVNLDNDINVNAGDHYAYLLTDDSNILLEVIASDSYDFENASLTELRVHGIHYDGSLNPQIGSNRLSTTATGCFTHSNNNDFLTVLTDDCTPIFVCETSTTFLSGQSNTIDICPTDGIDDIVTFNNSLSAGPGVNYVYLVTDEDEILQEVHGSNSFNFESSTLNEQRVYGMHYNGNLEIELGSHRTLTTADDCFTHSGSSEFIRITKNACIAPFECLENSITTTNSLGSVDICPTDGQEDIIPLKNNLLIEPGMHYAYLITDASEILQEVVLNSMYNFEGSSLDEQRVYGIHYDGTLSPQLGQNRMMTAASGCFTHSESNIFLTITKNSCIAPFECMENLTATTDWLSNVDICPNDGLADRIALKNNLFIKPGTHYAYLITDESEIVQEVVLDSTYNFEGSSSEAQRVYGIHYDGVLQAMIGEDRMMTISSGCYTHSGGNIFLTITKNSCIAPFECMESLTATTDWLSNVDICPTDGLADRIALKNNLFIEPGINYAYLITDESEVLQEVVLDSTYNFEGSSLEAQRVYGIHYEGTLSPLIGQNRMMTTASGCFTHSGGNIFLTITKNNCIAAFECVESLTATFAWVTEVDICATDGEDDIVFLQNNINTPPGENYAFLITDEFEILQEVFLDSLYNFENSGTEEQRVYGMSYSGDLLAVIGADRKSTSATGCAIHSGDDLFIRINKTAACEAVSTNDLDLARDIKVFPNPSTGIFNIEYLNNDLELDSISVFGIDGKELNRNVNSRQLEISEAGIYFIRFSNQETSIIKRVVVQ